MKNYLIEKVAAIRPLDGRRIHVRFSDGFTGEIDLVSLLDRGPLFEPLREEASFRAVSLSRHGVPEWPGDLDLSPGSLRAWCEAGKLLSLQETDEWIERNGQPAESLA